MPLERRGPRVLVTREFRMSKGEPADRFPQHVTRRRLPVHTIEETRAGGDIRMSPPVQDYAGNVALGVESCAAEEFHHLAANLGFVVPIAGGKHFLTGDGALRRTRGTTLIERNVKGKNSGRIRIQYRTIIPHIHWRDQIGGVSE